MSLHIYVHLAVCLYGLSPRYIRHALCCSSFGLINYNSACMTLYIWTNYEDIKVGLGYCN